MTTETSTPKPRRGCLFYGGILLTVCLVAVLIAALIGVHLFKKMVNEFTDTKPVPLPALDMTPAQIEQVRQRVAAFSEAVQAGTATPPLTLNANEIDAVIASSPDFQSIKDKVFVTIENGQLKGQVSVPMGELGIRGFKGRYLNGVATVGVSLQNGTLLVFPQEILVKGKPIPPSYMSAFRQQNLATGFNVNPGVSNALARLQSIEIKEGKLVISPKGSP
jgi:hypothetical protein